MKRFLLLALIALPLSSCAARSTQINRGFGNIAGDYEMVSMDTTEAGRFVVMPVGAMLQEGGRALTMHLSSAGQAEVAMHVLDESQALRHRTWILGMFRVQNSRIFFSWSEEEPTFGMLRMYPVTYKLEKRSDATYLIFFIHYQGDELEDALEIARNQNDPRLKQRIKEGFQMVFKKK